MYNFILFTFQVTWQFAEVDKDDYGLATLSLLDP
jgi:hypothetical protein